MKLVNTTGQMEEYCKTRNIAEPIGLAADTKFKHLDLSFYSIIYKGSPWIGKGDGWKKEVEDCIKARESFSVDFCQSHAPDGEHFLDGEEKDALITATLRTIEACGMLGIPNTVVHAAAYKPELQKFVPKNIEFFKTFSEAAEKAGVDILVENSSEVWNKGYYLLSGEDMINFVKEAKMQRLHLCWDTGHANVEGRDQESDIIAMGNELKAVHIQDNFGISDLHTAPMMGTTNFDRVISGLIAADYKGCFTFEATSVLRNAVGWPAERNYIKKTDKLGIPSLELTKTAVNLCYDIGKWMLTSYGIKAE